MNCHSGLFTAWGHVQPALLSGWVGTLQWRPVSLSAAHHEAKQNPIP